MEIIFVWLNNFRNLNNLQFNLGSDYIYELSYEEDKSICKINRTLNDTYIPKFFNPYLNISAIVGENASGKSSILDGLRQILEEQRDYIEYLILFKDPEGNIFYKSFFGYDKQRQDELSIHPELNVGIYTEGFCILDGNTSDYMTIFFSQIIDLNIYPLRHDSPLGIDISSNWLSFDDIKDTPDNSGSTILAYHKHCESIRQISFCLNAQNKAFTSMMSLPDKIEIHFSTLVYAYHNTNYSLRGYDEILKRRLSDEINSTKDSKRRCYLYFLSDTINCIYKNFEISNHYLSSEVKIGKSKDEINSMPIEEAVKSFLLEQDLLDGRAAIDLFDSVKESINMSLESIDSSWLINISDKTLMLIQKYNDFLLSLNKFSSYGSPYGFISFDWRNMSTGEKAFLNLYSRFFYAKSLILQKIKLKNRYGIKQIGLPKTIYILIDEGEIGFHLQWQKDYIQNLINNIPSILSFNGHQMNYQIIFSTHSPMSLSDIPNDRILYICQGKVLNDKMNSFGANITDLMTHSFFLKDGLVGSFAINKINATIKWLNDSNNKDDAPFHKLLIQNIDEPLVHRKLTEMFVKKMRDEESKEIEKRYIQQQLEEYKNKYGEEL
ncbi:MAG: hypothetical protein LIR40_15615 [Bacteroidota bacterium]|nr:hypothetical protein [Bacteroidota bacterium]